MSFQFAFTSNSIQSTKVLKPFLVNYFQNLRKMSGTGRIENIIRRKLSTELDTDHLEVINESHFHHVPKGAETHFKLIVVTNKFDGLPLIKRHRLINDVLKNEYTNGVHAATIVALTPKQWEESSEKDAKSTAKCRGGFGL